MIVFDRQLCYNARIVILLFLTIGVIGQGNRRTLKCLRGRNCKTATQAVAPPTPTLSFSWGGIVSGPGSTGEDETVPDAPAAPSNIVLQQPTPTGLIQGITVPETTSTPIIVDSLPSESEAESGPASPASDENSPVEPTGDLTSTPQADESDSQTGRKSDQIEKVKKRRQQSDSEETVPGLTPSSPNSNSNSNQDDARGANVKSPTKKPVEEASQGSGTAGDETDGAESSSFYDDQVLQSLSQNLQIPRETEGESEVATGCSTIPYEIARYPNLVVLSQALEASGLLKYLDNPKLEVTLFAPTDLAFELMLEKKKLTLKEFLADHKSVREVLSLHIALQPLVTSNLRSSQSIDTRLSGTPILVSASLSDVLVVPPGGDAADVILADIPACKSVVHIVDQVLLPVQDPFGVFAG